MASFRVPARKRFGQHFLEPAWIQRLVGLIDPSPDDTFIEIGAGRGALTLALAPKVRRLMAVEIDRDLAAGLTDRGLEGVEVVVGDILRLDLAELCTRADPTGGAIRVAGNLPYYISTPILGRVTELAQARPSLTDATVMLQREVVERLTAGPGTKAYGALTVLIRLLADAEQLATVPAGAFRPAPPVASAIVRLRFHPPAVRLNSARAFEVVVKALFSQRRKTLRNALRPLAASRRSSAVERLSSIGVDPTRRPETLDLYEFAAVANLFEPLDEPTVL